MSDDWFDGFDVEAADAAPPAAEREPVPEGEHVFEVKKVIDHEDKLEIRLAHAERRYGWVFCRLPKNADWAKRLASEFRQAVGVEKGRLMAAIEMQELDGKQVQARIYHRGTYVNVGGFTAAPAPEETLAKKPRGHVAKTLAALKEAAPDDIPF